MSTTQTLILGGIAGFTIFLGLPIARMPNVSPTLRASLTALATGILVFLFWDVVSHAVDPIESHLASHSWAPFSGYAALLIAGFGTGFMGLVYYDQWLRGRRAGADERRRSTSSSTAPGTRR